MSAPDITDLEVSAVSKVLRSGCLSIGPKLGEFEQRFSEYVGRRHAIGVANGTAGLHLAVLAAGIRRGDLVITTPFSFVASSNCLLYEGAEPVFVDVDPVTGNIDVALVAAMLRDLQADEPVRGTRRRGCRTRGPRRRRVKAILPVHVFGQPADMDGLLEIARDHGLAVIEDACEALGADYKHRRAGALGDAAVFGFYPNKQITTGEGGVVVTDHDQWASRIRSQRNQGRDSMNAWLRHERLGYNYRLDEMSAALGCAQLERVEELLAARDRVAGWYRERLVGVPGIAVPEIVPATTRMSWFVYAVRLGEGVNRQAVMDDLSALGIPSRAYFSPIHLQPFFVNQFGYARGDCPVAEALGDSCLALPFSGKLDESQVERVCEALLELVARHTGPADRTDPAMYAAL